MKSLSAAIIIASSVTSLSMINISSAKTEAQLFLSVTFLLVLFFGLKGWILEMNRPN